MKHESINFITVKNFKSIKSARVRLSHLNALIGNNGSGKSSIIEALKLVKDVVSKKIYSLTSESLNLYLSCLKDLRHKNANNKAIEVHLEGYLDLEEKKKYIYKVALNFSKETGHIYTEKESLIIKINKEEKEIFSSSGNENTPFILILNDSTHLDAIELRNYILRWEFVNILSCNLNSPVYKNCIEDAFPEINSFEDSLLEILSHYLLSTSSIYRLVVRRMKYLFPELDSIVPSDQYKEEEQEKGLLKFKEKSLKTYIESWSYSPAALKMLILLSLLNSAYPPSLIIIEEIENGLDFQTLNLLVSELNSTMQILLTTNSPYLLDLLDLSHVIVAEKEKSNTSYFRPDNDKKLIEWKKEFRTGELWTLRKFEKYKGK